MNDIAGQWWPSTEAPCAGDFEDVVYAAFGPSLTHMMVVAFERHLEPIESLDPSVRRFFNELRERDGHLPIMLPLLAVASVGALFIRSPEERENPRYQSVVENQDLLHNARRSFGWFVEGALNAFGFREEILAEYLTRHWKPYGQGTWPPPGIGYTRQPPGGGRFISKDTSIDADTIQTGTSHNDFLDFWRSLRDYPSLIGAHLVQMRELQRYVQALEQALGNVQEDIRACELNDPEQAELKLRQAVNMVSDAFDMVREAQDIIVRNFPT